MVKYIVWAYFVVFGLCVVYLGIRTIERISYNKAVAECQANQSRNIAQTAQIRQDIVNNVRQMPVSERRKIMEQWVVE